VPTPKQEYQKVSNSHWFFRIEVNLDLCGVKLEEMTEIFFAEVRKEMLAHFQYNLDGRYHEIF